MLGHGEKLSRLQEQAVAALLAWPTIAQAAQHVGVAESTLTRWLKRPTFKAAYAEARRSAFEAAADSLVAASGEAVQTLRDLLTDEKAGIRLRAAQTILELSARALETMDIEARLSELEERVSQSTNGSHQMRMWR
jgi:hypothetical protein